MRSRSFGPSLIILACIFPFFVQARDFSCSDLRAFSQRVLENYLFGEESLSQFTSSADFQKIFAIELGENLNNRDSFSLGGPGCRNLERLFRGECCEVLEGRTEDVRSLAQAFVSSVDVANRLIFPGRTGGFVPELAMVFGGVRLAPAGNGLRVIEVVNPESFGESLGYGDEVTDCLLGEGQWSSLQGWSVGRFVDLYKYSFGFPLKALRIHGAKGVRTLEVPKAMEHMLLRSRVETWDRLRLARIEIHDFYEGSFGQGASEHFLRRLLELGTERIDGIILDLRGNQGNNVDAALRIGSVFLPERVLVQSKKRVDYQVKIEVTRALAIDGGKPLPLVVLVDHSTGGAAELLVGALKEYGRGLILGKRTQGNAKIIEVAKVRDFLGDIGAANVWPVGILALVRGYYYLPSGVSFQGKGIDPHVTLGSSSVAPGAGSPGETGKDFRLGELVDMKQGKEFVSPATFSYLSKKRTDAVVPKSSPEDIEILSYAAEWVTVYRNNQLPRDSF